MILTGALLKTIRGKRLKDILMILPENATDAEKGEVVYLRKCSTCHQGGSPMSGPPLHDVFHLKGERWLRSYTRTPRRFNPEAFMPPVELTQVEELRIIAYLAEMRSHGR